MSSSVHNRFVSVTIKKTDEQEIIETKSIDESQDNNICTICYSQIDDDTKSTLKCGHTYHTDCYTQYIAYNIVNKKETITCPVCRNNIVEIIVNKPEVIHIITGDGDNDIESQSVYHDDNTIQSGCYISAQCCGNLVLKLMMLGAIYCLLHFTIYCTTYDSC
jgi:Ring finger domain